MTVKEKCDCGRKVVITVTVCKADGELIDRESYCETCALHHKIGSALKDIGFHLTTSMFKEKP